MPFFCPKIAKKLVLDKKYLKFYLNIMKGKIRYYPTVSTVWSFSVRIRRKISAALASAMVLRVPFRAYRIAGPQKRRGDEKPLLGLSPEQLDFEEKHV